MKTEKFDAWVKKILKTEDEEISCSVCFDLLSDYVDEEFSGKDIRPELIKVEQHLNQCQVCMEEYEILRDLVGFDSTTESEPSGE